MYKNIKVSKQTRCLICHEPIEKNISLSTLLNPQMICIDCYKQFKVINLKTQLSSYPLTVLYEYNEFFKTVLFRYKGQYDYMLRFSFFTFCKETLIHYYKDYIVVVAPSNEDENEVRGYAPMKEIAKTLNLRLFDGIYKKVKYKQSLSTYEERLNVENKLGIINGERLTGEKVLILDDVMTSGSTIKACIKLVEKYNPKKIELLVLSKVNHKENISK